LNVALGCEIIDLRGLDLLDDADQAGAVGEVAVVELETDVGFVEITVEVIDPSGVERGGAPFDTVDNVALAQQKFREIGAVLSSHPGDQSDFVGHEANVTSLLSCRMGFDSLRSFEVQPSFSYWVLESSKGRSSRT
jgi:hypothetical protein